MNIDYEYIVSDSTKKRFLVISSTNQKFIGKEFTVHTHIRNSVQLPFTDIEYNCISFNGVELTLKHGDDLIIGSLF